jgi:hypothetical protein
MILKYDLKIWSQNMISKYDLKIWSQNMISKYDLKFFFHHLENAFSYCQSQSEPIK